MIILAKKVSTSFNTSRYCKIVCVFGKKKLLFGKNSDMTILIEKEYFLWQLQRNKFDRLSQKTTLILK